MYCTAWFRVYVRAHGFVRLWPDSGLRVLAVLGGGCRFGFRGVDFGAESGVQDFGLFGGCVSWAATRG